jgi:hypothetical protein
MQTTTVHTTVGTEIFRWLLFGVVLSLLPLASNKVVAWLVAKPLSVHDILKEGELLLIGTGLAGFALSDILASRRGGVLGQFAIWFSMAMIILASLAYGTVRAASGSLNEDAVVQYSTIMFGACILAGGAGVLMREVSK